MKAKNKHCAYWNSGDEFGFNTVYTQAKVNNSVYREDVDYIVEDNMEDELFLVYMPVE